MQSRPIAHSVNSACGAIACGKTKLYDLIAEGRLDARKMGQKTVITDESLVRLIEELPKAEITGLGQGAVVPRHGASKDEPAADAEAAP